MDLARDDFVEGLVAGAAGVYREVLPVVLERQDSGAPVTLPNLDEMGDQGGAALDLQMILQEQQQVLQILSNVSKTLHAAAESVIRKAR
jgi:hypothetical protein